MNNFKRYFQFLLIVLAAGSIYPLIYLRSSYQETILQVFNMTNEQLNGIYSGLGLAFLAGYFPSGWIADKFSAKKLLFVSMFMCGLAGIWFAQIPNYSTVLIIFIIWGIFAVFTFWASHLKLVKLIAKKEEEGRFFGILDGGRGVVEAILASIAIFIFSRTLGGSESLEASRQALQAVIYLYSIVMLVVAVLVLLFVKENTEKAAELSDVPKTAPMKLNAATLKKIFTNKLVWLLGSVILFSYAVFWSNFYLGGFLQTNIEIDAVTVGTVMLIFLWTRPIGGVGGGILADKFGKSSILMVALAFAALLYITLGILPSTMPQMTFKILVILIGVMVFTIRGLYWALLGDCEIEPSILGLSIGFISLLGYLPDFFWPVINTNFTTNLGNYQGQNAFFIFTGAIALVAVVCTALFKAAVKKEANLKVERQQNENIRKAVTTSV